MAVSKLKSLLSQAQRRNKTHVSISLDVFGPEDRRALIMRMGK